MTDTRITQPSGNAGELAEEIWGRRDLARRQSGLRKLLNGFVHAHGGVSNRAGLRFVSEVKDSTKRNRLSIFEPAADEAFVLVWGDLNVRPIYRGSWIAEPPYEIVTEYPHTTIDGLRSEQSNDVLTIVGHPFSIAELSRYDVLDWRIEGVTFSPRTPAPTGLTATKTEGFTGYGGDKRPKTYTYKVAAIGPDGEESLPSLEALSSGTLVLGYEKNFVRLEWIGAATISQSVPPGGYVDYSSPNTHIALDNKLPNNHTIESVGLYTNIVGYPSASLKVVKDNGNNTFDVVAVTNTQAVSTGGWTMIDLTAPFDIPPTGDYYVAVNWAPFANQGYANALNGPRRVITGNPGIGVSYAAPSSSGYYIPTRAFSYPVGSTAREIASEYAIYKEENGLFGYIGSTKDTTFDDTNFKPDFTRGPQDGSNPFVDGNNPSVVAFFQQRRMFANSIESPQKAWGTRSANYKNMSKSTPTRDDDALEFNLASERKQDIYHMVAVADGILVFTRSGEWRITGREGDILTPGSILPLPQSGYGSSKRLRPMRVGSQLLFAPANEANILEIGFNFQADKYLAVDLTVLSEHLFEGRRIVAWDYASHPYSIVYMVMDDGQGVCLTYLKEHEVWGFSRMTTRGKLLDVAVAAEGSRDVPYFIVERYVGGVAKQYIEYLEDRRITDIRNCFFVDSGLSLDNPMSITAIACGAQTVLTAPAHGLVNGDLVEVDALTMFDLDDNRAMPIDGKWKVAGVTTNTFRLTHLYDIEDSGIVAGDDLATSGYATWFYLGDGVARKGVKYVVGLDHLLGRKLAALVDGHVIEGLIAQTIYDGDTPLGVGVAFDEFSFRAHVGLPYQSIIQTLDLINPEADDTGIYKAVPQVTLRVKNTRGVRVGMSEETATEEYWSRDNENYGEPATLYSGLQPLTLWEPTAMEQCITVIQDNPLPVTITGWTNAQNYEGDGIG